MLIKLKGKCKKLEERFLLLTGPTINKLVENHYKNMKIQPSEFILRINCFLQKEMLLNISADIKIKEKYKIWKKQNITSI